MRTYDAADVAKAARDFLEAVGEDTNREGLRETPDRIARAYTEIFSGLGEDPGAALDTQFDIGYRDLVTVRDITFYSMCEHHLLPFYGRAHVAYLPGAEGRVTGLSKMARLVEGFARRPQVQERLTTQVADALVEHLHVAGCLVVIEAEHMCMTMRGIKKPGSSTVTAVARGVLTDPVRRAEAMALIRG